MDLPPDRRLKGIAATVAVGITSALQAFRHIVDITKRSRDYFEARVIASDVMFTLFANPMHAAEEFMTGRKQQFDNEDITLSDTYYVQCASEEMALPAYDGEDEEISGDAQSVTYKKVSTEISKKDDRVMSIDTFHVIEEDEQ